MKGFFYRLKKLKAFRGLRAISESWVLYDVGNSAFTMLSCSLIPIWFKALAIGTGAGQLTSDDATGVWALGVVAGHGAGCAFGPVCGALADHKDRKRIFFRTSVFLGVGGCILNGFATGWMLFFVLFILVKIAYSCSLVFYDSMLNDVTEPGRHGRSLFLRLRLGLYRLLHPLHSRAGALCPGAGYVGHFAGHRFPRGRVFCSPPCGGCWSPCRC